MSGGEVSGVDLARVVLRAAMETAQKNGNSQKTQQKPQPVRTVRRDGREPMALGAAIGALVAERAWELPHRRRFPAPVVGSHRPRRARSRRRLRCRLRPAHRLPGIGGLGDEGPDGTDPRHRGRQRVGRRTVVRALRIPAPGSVPGSVPVPSPDDGVPQAPEAPKEPVKTRELASDGYRRAAGGVPCSLKLPPPARTATSFGNGSAVFERAEFPTAVGPPAVAWVSTGRWSRLHAPQPVVTTAQDRRRRQAVLTTRLL